MTKGITVTGMTSAYDSEIIWIERTDKELDPPATNPTAPTETVTLPVSDPTESTPAETQPCVYFTMGDAEQDNEVNIRDATAIQKHIANLETLSENALLCADADQNNNINIKDATAIQKHIAGIPTGYPIGEKICTLPEVTRPVTQPTDPPETEAPAEQTTVTDYKTYVYMKNAAGWSDVYCYYWSDSEGEAHPWYGVRMEHFKDNIYRYEVPQKYQNIIFNNGQGTQTADLKVSYSSIFSNSTNQWEPFITG